MVSSECQKRCLCHSELVEESPSTIALFMGYFATLSMTEAT